MCLFLFQIWFALVYLWKCAMHNTPKCIQVRQDLWCLHSTVVLVKYDSRCISCIMLFQDAVVPLCFCLENTYYPSSAFLLSAKLAKRMSRWYANMLSAVMLICLAATHTTLYYTFCQLTESAVNGVFHVVAFHIVAVGTMPMKLSVSITYVLANFKESIA